MLDIYFFFLCVRMKWTGGSPSVLLVCSFCVMLLVIVYVAEHMSNGAIGFAFDFWNKSCSADLASITVEFNYLVCIMSRVDSPETE